MLGFIVLLPCIASALAGGKDPLDDRIIGGQPAAYGQFPYQVSMRWRQSNQHSCGGSILTQRHILTAAHCVYQHFISDFIVVVGTTHLSDGQVYTLENIVFHHGYSPDNLTHDIALMKTSSDIVFSTLVQPIPLLSTDVPVGASMVLSGWGLSTWPGNGLPDTLQWANLIHLDINTCAQLLQTSEIFLTKICTFTRPGQGACQGDSGGPLVYAGSLAGVVSWGRPCAVGYPDVFTRVSAYIDWINKSISNM